MAHPLMFLLLATIAYSLPFIMPSSFWWLIFLFPPFLFLAIYQNKLRWPHLFIWSITISTIHLLPIGDAIIRMTSASLSLQLLPTIILILYVALYPFGFLMGVRVLFRTVSTLFEKVLIWTVGFWLYLLTIDYALFWLFGRIEGYVFMNPLLPLTTAPSLLALLHWVPMPAMLLVYCITTSFITWSLLNRSIISAALASIMLSIWLLPALVTNNTMQPPAWIQQVGHLPITLPDTMPAERGAMLIAHEVQQLIAMHPDLQLVVMPESAWNGLPLNGITTLPVLQKIAVPHLIIGSFSCDNQIHCNSLYWFDRGQRAGRFDKQHALPFVERIPWGASSLCKNLFFKKSAPLCPITGSRGFITIEGTRLVPYICSELFMNNIPYDPSSTMPILATCNDWWFGVAHFKKLMLMTAQLRALQWQRSLLYLSFHYAQYIDPYGKKHPIATTI